MIKNLFVLVSLCFVAFMWTGCEKEPDPVATSFSYVHGNNQSAYITQQLADSLVVIVKNNKGLPFSGVAITFQVDSNIFGTLSSTIVTTDSLGLAYVYWTLGSYVGNQTVTASADSLTGSPYVFTAEGIPWTQDSRDGKTYRTVTISTQRWLAENLDYNSSGSWQNPSNPSSVYGRLYDWTTANTVCPSGWHLPSDAEWSDLEAAIGSSNVGTQMKSNSGWTLGGGDNSSGFNAYPSGVVNSIDTTFSGLFTETNFWSSTTNDATTAWRRRLFTSSVGVTKGYIDKTMGLSCRCIED